MSASVLRLLVLLTAPLALASGSHPAATVAHRELPVRAGADEAGTVEGTVHLPRRPDRRTARRYGARGASSGLPLQPLPAVAFIPGPDRPPAVPPDERLRMWQRDSTFVPALVVVPVGTEVDFPNGDPIFHNVFSYSSAARFDLGRYPRGESRTVVFDEPGVVKVFCEVHEHMRAAVIVVENGLHTVVEEDGSFRIEGVPPGRHELVVWHPDLDEAVVEVDVPERGTARVSVEWR